MSASSSSRTDAGRCPHFGECGGCASQDVAYGDQLHAKEKRVAESLACAGLNLPLKIHPSPETRYYRNKAEISFGDVYPPQEDGPWLYLGFKMKGRWHKVVDVAECRLLSPEVGPLLASIREWAEREAVPPYNTKRHVGFMRHLVLREAKNTAERMVMLVTAPGELPRDSFLKAVEPYRPTTVLHGLNESVSDTALAGSRQVLSGEGSIMEILRFPGRAPSGEGRPACASGDSGLLGRELRFRVSPQSFFQTNTHGAELLYGRLRDWVRELSPGVVLDLYCGGGGIGLSVADSCKEVVGVESNPLGVADAGVNAGLNGITNAGFIQGAAEEAMASLPEADAVIVDPPRAGLHPKLLKTIMEKPAPFLLYVSCNPEALGRDLKTLREVYSAERAEVFDLFPHTPHVETAALLRRRS